MPKKSLVVGLGGTGDWVLTFLKSRLFAAYGEAATKADVQFLLVDTIHSKARESAFEGTGKITVGYTDQHEERVARLGQVRVENLEYLPLVGTIQDTARRIQSGEPQVRHLNWFPAGFYLGSLPAAAMDITLGAGQWRQFGRMALVLGTERGEFKGKIRRLIQEANVAANDDLMVYVVCSLGGGTGAGMFLDAANIIRDVASKANTQIWIVGFLLLPGAFDNVWSEHVKETAIPRSYAAFRELTRFQTVAGKNAPFPVRYSVNAEDQIAVTDKLYDTVFLLDAVGKLEKAPPWSGVSPCIADGLEVFLDRTRGSQILENLVNASARMARDVQMNQTLPAQFHSMGSHKIVLPARQYAHIFTSEFTKEFFGRIFPQRAEGGGPPMLLKDEIGAPAYAELALDCMKGIPSLFTKIVDYLPERQKRDDRTSFENFAKANLNVYRSLLVPAKDDPSLSLEMLDKDPLRRDDDDEDPLPTSDETKEEPEVAAKDVERACNQRLEAYWNKLGPLVERVKKQLEAEMTDVLERQVAAILNGDVSDAKTAALRAYPVGSAVAFLDQVAFQCDNLVEQVLAKAEERVFKRDFTPEQWRVRVNQAKTQMESSFTGFFRKNRAATAQKAYIGEVGRQADSDKMALVFNTFKELTRLLKAKANEIRGVVMSWARLATLDTAEGALAFAERDIATIETALRESGRSYTSSYGLSAFDGGRVDTTMGGYRQKLYRRIAQPLVDSWVNGHGWQFQDHGLVFTVKTPAETAVAAAERVKSGEDFYKWVFKQVQNDIQPQLTGLSIFDYFLEDSKSEEERARKPEEVAKFLHEHTFELMSEIQPLPGTQARESRELYLLVKRPAKQEAVAFYEDLVLKIKDFYSGSTVTFQSGMAEDFDNPYTLTLLYLIQDIRDGQIRLMNENARKYNEAILGSDAHVVNHVFRAEQEAGRLEKATNTRLGNSGAGENWTRIDARVCRLLDEPERVKLFFQLLALDVIRLAPHPSQTGTNVWMVLAPGNDDPTGPRVVWLTRPSATGDQSAALSLLYAAERFCLMGTSAKPGGEIPINYAELEKARESRSRALMADGQFDKLIEQYQQFLDGSLVPVLEEYVEFRNLGDESAAGVVSLSEDADGLRSPDARSLKILAAFYLDEEIRKLRAAKNAQARFRPETTAPQGG